jgi:hypothetical protein
MLVVFSLSNQTVLKYNLLSSNMSPAYRYNISTGEFDGWNSSVNASLNQPRNGPKASLLNVGERFGFNYTQASDRGYLFKQNPVVSLFGGDVGKSFQLRLAINTNQIGRVFQDR